MIRQSDIDALESVVLDGHGGKLIGEELPTTADNKTRAFLRNVPEYLVSTQCGNCGNLLPPFCRKNSVKATFSLKNFTLN